MLANTRPVVPKACLLAFLGSMTCRPPVPVCPMTLSTKLTTHTPNRKRPPRVAMSPPPLIRKNRHPRNTQPVKSAPPRPKARKNSLTFRRPEQKVVQKETAPLDHAPPYWPLRQNKRHHDLIAPHLPRTLGARRIDRPPDGHQVLPEYYRHVAVDPALLVGSDKIGAGVGVHKPLGSKPRTPSRVARSGADVSP